LKRIEKKQPQVARSGDVWIYVALAAAIFAVYARVAAYDFINYGDPAVTGEPRVYGGFTRGGIAWAFSSAHHSWMPLTWLSYMLDCQLFGLQSGVEHVVNVLFHTIATLLLFGLLRKLTGARWPSAFVAFVFGLHPVNIESVAWIAQRKNVLGGLFWMLTLWTYVRYMGQRSAPRYLAVAALFCCALLSNPAAAMLPVALLLLDFWPLQRFSRAAMIEKIPLAALSAAAIAMDLLAHKPAAGHIANALLSPAVYIAKVLVPINLAVVYPDGAIPAWQTTLAALALAAVTWIGVRARPYLAMGWLWFLATLLPVIALRADRYLYIPVIGLAIMLAWGLAELYVRWRTPVLATGIAASAAWFAVSWVNLDHWQNSLTLFQHAIDVTDANHVAYNHLGSALLHQGRLQDAIRNLETALRIQPGDAVAQENFGEALLVSGRVADALPHMQRAVALCPDSARAHAGLASALFDGGHSDDAVTEYRTALRLDPGSNDSRYGLAVVLADQGNLQAALAYFTEQVRIQPDDPEPHYKLGRIDSILGRSDEAIAELSAAVRLQPDDPQAHYELGVAFASRGRVDEAFGELGAAVRLRPDSAKNRVRFAEILFRLGRPQEASSQLREALRIDPDFPDARTMAGQLGWK
jgi:tetratricopeptide (TPR) repeat protein